MASDKRKLYNNYDWDCHQVVIAGQPKLVSELSEEESKDQLCRLLLYFDMLQSRLAGVDEVLEACADGDD